MKYKKFFRVLAVAFTMALVMLAIPASPAMAVDYTVNVENNKPTSEYYLEPMGEPGDSIRIWGGGPGGTEINIYFSSQNVAVGKSIDTDVKTYDWMTSTTINAMSETYNVTTLHVPTSLTDGTVDEDIHGGVYYIYITTTASKAIKAKTTFYVTGVAQAEIDIVEGPVGTEVEITGEGFAPDEDITVEYGGVDITDEVEDDYADEDGNILLTFLIPDSTFGEHTITITGVESLAEVELTFTVESAITINPASGEVGTLVTVTGTGFARRNGVDFKFGANPITVVWLVESAGRTNSSGSFAVTMVVPAVTTGNYTILAVDEDNDDISAQRTFAVTVPPLNPTINIDPTSGKVGDTVTINGTEFGNNKPIKLYLDTTEITPTAPITTGDTGSFSGSFKIPEIAGGSHTIKAEDDAAHSDTATLTVEPEMTMTPLTGVMGDEIDVSGTGFGANKTITIMYGTAALPQTAPITTNPKGSFSGSFLVPAIPGGSRTLTVTDGTISLTATFTVKAGVIISPNSGIVGSGVGAGGYGFGATKAITFLFNNTPVTPVAPVMTDANGIFSNAQFFVPASPAGTATITITDTFPITESANSVNISFVVLAPTASISPVTGIIGTTVTVSGTNFAAGGTVTIKYYLAAGSTTGSTEEFTATASSTGVLSTTFNIPASGSGNHAIIISDGANSVSTSFAVASGITVSPTTSTSSPGYVGLKLTVSGTGFKANAPITITYASDPVELATTTSNDKGSFSVDITIPESVSGEHTITVSDGVNTKQSAFIMESTPPAAPVPVQIWVGNKAKQPITFGWHEVDDYSRPVTYNLEIATDANFTNIVLGKTELDEPGYTLTEAEKLEPVSKKEPYYWHVQAVDSAGNAGAWSTADSFSISGGWPSWLMWLGIGLGALLVIILGFWLGRRSTYAAY